ncbi:hypothetical protein LCGC14_1051750 [marine sediment metagenome]|uniref:Uncharacterized protein n=1 Tax=marine sediment metagenome TaxID=412755 RepID=A0A0F9Q6S1_9ZZZZ
MTQTASGLDKTRLGQCYQLAGEYAIEDENRILVHGTIQRDPYPDNPHAWVEWEEWDDENGWDDCWMVWEPISKDILPRPVFYALFGAREHDRYDTDTQWGWMEETRNWGPWEGDYWQVDVAHVVKGKEA